MKWLLLTLPLLILKTETPTPKKPFALSVDQIKYITDSTGVLLPGAIINTEPGQIVRMYLTDGVEYTGLVKEVEREEGKIYKIFGEMTSHHNVGFGFVIAQGGIFAGAIVDKPNNTEYAAQLSEAHKGFVFMKTHSKQNI